MEGRVYAIGSPVVSGNPSPEPLESISTVVVLDSTRNPIKEVATDEHGHFAVVLPAGIYFLQVKESLIPEITGPFTIVAGRIATAEAHFDNGIR